MIDFDAYPDKEVTELYNRYREETQRVDAGALLVLKKLLRKAKSLGDDELVGYTHYMMASEQYFNHGDYDGFLKNTYLAAKHFVRSGDETQMKNVYYLVAIDALNKGMYDISYTYNLRLGEIARRLGQETSAAISDLSVGYALLRAGMYGDARKFIRRGYDVVKKDKEHTYYYYNVMSSFLNEGTVCLNLGEYEEAERLYRKAEYFMDRNPEFVNADLRYSSAQLGICVAVEQRLTEETKKRMALLLEYARQVTQISDSMEDAYDTCKRLLAHGYTEAAGEFISVLEDSNIAMDATHSRRLLVDMKISYYEATGNREGMEQCFREQGAIFARLRKEHRKSFRFVKDLLTLAEELQKERVRVRAEHKRLVVKAETDALTRIANRRAMNKQLDTAFERAYKNNTSFAVSILDMDGLKAYNDTHGHPAGDARLIETARELASLMRDKRIFAARYGGDEFVLLFENMTNREIRDALEACAKKLVLTMSCGVCSGVPTEKERSWEYLAFADKALYEAKRAKHKQPEGGKSRIRFRKPATNINR